MIGRTLSHYKILSEVSRGGMGIVYRALDLKLHREVALKVLPQGLVADEERKARFVQEARAAAALFHPHIATVFEIDEADGTTFIAMELIEGGKLRQVLSPGPMPVPRALSIATEVAEGLGRAHQKGVVHRDLKPENIMITEDGHAKIIDFGLAKLVEPFAGRYASGAETAARLETDSGTILGTVSYMSPEQARGEKVDHRSDIFSLGVVFQEMLTGECPFVRGSAAETLSAILKEPPPSLDASRIGAPLDLVSRLQHLLDKCLAKDREERYQSTKDLTLDLRWIQRDSDSELARPRERTHASTRTFPRSVAAGAILFVGAVALLVWPRAERVPRLANPTQVTSAIGVEAYPTWSPSGMLAYHLDPVDYSGNTDIWVTQPGSGSALNLTGEHRGADLYPSYSPDGHQIAFWSARDGEGYVVMPALGGPPRKILTGSVFGTGTSRPQWSSDGKRVACVVREMGSRAIVVVVTLDTGESRRIPLPGRDVNSWDLAWSPDQSYFAYVDAKSDTSQVGRLLVLGLQDGKTSEVTDGLAAVWSPNWSSDGRGLFYVSNRRGSMDLWWQRMEGGKPISDPQAMTTGVGITSAAFSPDGRNLAYSKGRVVANVWRVPLFSYRPATWSDARQLTFDEAYVEMVDVSRDGQRLVVSSDRAGNPDLWLLPAEGGSMQPLTTDPTPDWAPRWSPDGKEIAFYAFRTGRREIWVQPLSGGPARQLTWSEVESVYPDWSPDGREIVFYSARQGKIQLWAVSSTGGEPRPVTVDSRDSWDPGWSPDGDWVAYRSESTGSLWRISSKGGEPQKLTDAEGDMPRWSTDGKWVYFVGDGESAGNLWAVPAAGGAARKVTDLVGKRGTLDLSALATDGKFLYFSWREGLGDIWVMDVVPP